MNSSVEAHAFTETLLSAVRLQRHLAVRIIISTQEPTISTALLNLCSVTIVHRFSSPEWLRILRHHLAAAADGPFLLEINKTTPTPAEGHCGENESISLFNKIVHLRVGEALLFCPSAIVDTKLRDGETTMERLGARYLKVKIRARLTSDGGRSVLSL